MGRVLRSWTVAWLLGAWMLPGCSGGDGGAVDATDVAREAAAEVADARAEQAEPPVEVVPPDLSPVEVDVRPEATVEVAVEVAEPAEAAEVAEPTDVPGPGDTGAEVEAAAEVVEVAEIDDAVETDGGDADTEQPPLVSACVECHTDKPRLVALLPEEPPESTESGGG
jgi:hypothetical protein